MRKRNLKVRSTSASKIHSTDRSGSSKHNENRRTPQSSKQLIQGENQRINYQKTVHRNIKLREIKNDIKEEIDNANEMRQSNKLVEKDQDRYTEIIAKGYRVKNKIGSGSYAHVYYALNLNTRKEVALKLIELDKCTKRYKEDFLHSEIHVIRRLGHENIVQFYEAFNVHDGYVMVMEYIDAGTFADILKNGPTSEDYANKLFKDTSNGLAHMHSMNIAHRDLKLENLLLTRTNIGKISDFSLSVIWDGKDLLSNFCGTPPYFAPEILKKEPYNPLLLDIWSHGVCLYILLNDTIPFICSDDKLMLDMQIAKKWKFRDNCEQTLSNKVKNLIRLMLEPDPNLRLSITDILTSKWLTT